MSRMAYSKELYARLEALENAPTDLEAGERLDDLEAADEDFQDQIDALDGTMATTAGAGITGGTGTVYANSVSKVGGIYYTKIIINLDGLASSATDHDIIGVAGGPAHLGQITAAKNGTIFIGRMTCLEVPTTGADDIDLYAATEDTGEFDGLVTDLTETALVNAAGAWTLNLTKVFQTVAADKYLYLAAGEGSANGTYDAGKFMIELEGYDA